MTAAERWGAAYATAGLSLKSDELFALDRAEDEAVRVPAQRTSTP